jgi:hypothetical protein
MDRLHEWAATILLSSCARDRHDDDDDDDDLTLRALFQICHRIERLSKGNVRSITGRSAPAS